MKISYNWLKNYIDIDLPAEEAARYLTGCGLEVEGVEPFESVKGGLKGVVIGEVLTCMKHPNSDHLSLTTVDIGQPEPLKIVCGASNVAAGQKVAVALVGTKLTLKGEEITIKEAKIRGEQSFGMICAEDELGLGDSHAGIMVLDPSAVPGTLASDYFKIINDEVLEIGLTPNRSDATSHFGVARDLATVLNNLDTPIGTYNVIKPDVSAFKPDHLNRITEVVVEDEQACPRYSGLTLTNVKVKESPEWLKAKLSAIGLRPINNIVDITNFVLHEIGQPLHAFDADKIEGGRVVIRKLSQDTPFVTLDEVERKLHADDLMICNVQGPMCIAGVFGGMHSGVTDGTTAIFLESAYFDPKSVRKTSKRHGLQTDASFRFERGADPDITIFALKRAALLMKELADAEISSDIIDVYPKPIAKPEVQVAFSHVDRLIGQFIPRERIESILLALGITILEKSSEGLLLQIPLFKTDVVREADVIEEILRIYGYNNIGFTTDINASISYMEKPAKERVRLIVSEFLTSNGFFEIMNNSLTKSSYYRDNPIFKEEACVKIVNPLSKDLDTMRQTLLYGGLESIVYNQNRKRSNVKLYEFGNTYRQFGPMESAQPLNSIGEEMHLSLLLAGKATIESWNSNEKDSDFFELKGFLHSIFLRVGIDTAKIKAEPSSDELFSGGLTYHYAGKPLVSFGIVRKSIVNAVDCKQVVYYAELNWDHLLASLPKKEKAFKELPKTLEVRRDLALLLDRSVTFADLKKHAFEVERNLLKSVSLFDVYEGDKVAEGKKSYALSYIIQDQERTLKDEEIDAIMQKIVKRYQEKLNATLRS